MARAEAPHQASREIESFIRSVPTRTAASDAAGLAGSRRLSLELADRPALAASLSGRYERLVQGMADILREQLQGMRGAEREEGFIRGIWSVMRSNLGFTYRGQDYLYQALQTNRFDCDTSAYLAHDVAGLLGIESNIVRTTGHSLLRTSSFFFETSDFERPTFGRIGQLAQRYAMTYTIPRGREAAEDLLVEAHRRIIGGRHDLAMVAIDRAISIDPDNLFAFQRRILLWLNMAGITDDPSERRRCLERAQRDERRIEAPLRRMVGGHLPLFRTFALSVMYSSRVAHLSTLIGRTDDPAERERLVARRAEAQRRQLEEQVNEVSAVLAIPNASNGLSSVYLGLRADHYDRLARLSSDSRVRGRYAGLAAADRRAASLLFR